MRLGDTSIETKGCRRWMAMAAFIVVVHDFVNNTAIGAWDWWCVHHPQRRAGHHRGWHVHPWSWPVHPRRWCSWRGVCMLGVQGPFKDGGKLVECLCLVRAELCEGGCRCGVLEHVDQIVGSENGSVGGRCGRHLELLWKKFDSISDTSGRSGSYVHCVAPIVFGCIPSVPAVKSVWCPGWALCRFVVQDDAGAEWGHGGSIIVECAVEMLFGGQSRI